VSNSSRNAVVMQAFAHRHGRGDAPQHLYTGAGLLQGVKDGQLQALQLISRLATFKVQLQAVRSSLVSTLVQHVLRPTGERQQGSSNQEHQQQQQQQPPPAPPVGNSAKAEGSIGKDSSGSSLAWCAAVSALASIWPASCHLLDPATVVEVLQAVLQGVVQVRLQFQLPSSTWAHQQHQLSKDFEMMAEGLHPHAALVTAVLQHGDLVRQLADVADATGITCLAQCMAKMVVACGLPLRELPAAHAALCELVCSGLPQGANVLICLTFPELHEQVGVWQDPALQAASLEGTRRAAAALMAAVARERSRGAAGASTSVGQQQQQQQRQPVAEQGCTSGASCMAGGASGAAKHQAMAAPSTRNTPGKESTWTAGTDAGTSAAGSDGNQSCSTHVAARAAAEAGIPVSSVPVAPVDLASSACYWYVEAMVNLVEGQRAMQPLLDSQTSSALLAAAWQCVSQLLLRPRSWSERACESSEAWHAAKQLLSSSSARQVLVQQPGAMCSMEELCGVLAATQVLHCKLLIWRPCWVCWWQTAPAGLRCWLSRMPWGSWPGKLPTVIGGRHPVPIWRSCGLKGMTWLGEWWQAWQQVTRPG
jgi:hypothetical protein